MVKPGGGTKKKIKIEKITNKESLATSFTKRRYGLFSKISQLCLLTDAQIAVLATPLSSNSNVSFYSFGHTSVDSIVSAYLTGQRPVREETTTREHEDIGICMARKELGLDLWFEDERLLKSNNPEQLTDAINSMSRMLTNLKELSSDAVLQHPADQKTLTLQSNSPTTVLLDEDDDLPANSNNEDQTLTEEQDQIKDYAARTSLDFIEQLLSDSVVVRIFDAAVFLCSSKDAVPRMSVNTISSAESWLQKSEPFVLSA